ncbi:hypothetical protein KR038_005979, partial [Drosophila bunnanda]
FFLKLTKIGFLLLLWSYTTAAIVGGPIHEQEISVVILLPMETVVRDLRVLSAVIRITVQGAFTGTLPKIPRQFEQLNEIGLRVEWQDPVSNLTTQRSDIWTLYVHDKRSSFHKISHLFHKPKLDGNEAHGRLVLVSKSLKPLPLIVQADPHALFTKFGIVYAALLLLLLYILVLFELTDLTLGILLVASTATAALSKLGEQSSLHQVISWVDFRVLMLMLSMMIISGISSESGIFDWMAIQIYSISKGHKWIMLFLLAIITGLLSSVISNVMIVFMMSPIAVILSEATLVQTPLVIFVVIVYANIGGALTALGDLHNIVIASLTEVGFGEFTLHMFPGALGGLIVGLPVIYLTMRKKLHRLGDHQIMVSAKREALRQPLSEEVKELEAWLRMHHSLRSFISPTTNYFNTLAYLKTHFGIRDFVLVAKSLFGLIFVQVFFVVQTLPTKPAASIHVEALMGAILLIILCKLDNLPMVFHYLDWSVVLFLGGQLVFVAVLRELGLMSWLTVKTVQWISSVEAHDQGVVTILLSIWVSAFLAALVSNMAVTEMLVGLIHELTMKSEVSVPKLAIIWASSYGAAFGSNGTLLAANANLMGVVVARRFGYHISFLQFFLYSFPVMLATLTVASAYLLIANS